MKILTNDNKFALWNNKALQFVASEPEPPVPPVIPSVRVRTSDGNVPKKSWSTTYDSAILVPGTTDVYDVYKSGTSFDYLFQGSDNVVEVLGANTTGITSMSNMFIGCTSLTNVALFDTSNVTNMSSMFQTCSALTTVPLFDTSNVTNMESMFAFSQAFQSVPLFNTSNVTNMYYMFYGCVSLTSIPLFDTSNVTNMNDMFAQCNWVQSGALALYQQASTQTNPPSNHRGTFTNCGANTTTGEAELYQIPSSWGGYGA